MAQSPLEQAGSLHIGTVDYVSPGEIRVTLDIEAPESIALNAGGPRPFPRVNSYVLVPVDAGYLVGQIEWLTVERSPFPKRGGMKDFGVVDLPYPLRKMKLNPLGTLYRRTSGRAEEDEYSFRRGADALPSVGSAVLLPTERQLRSIVESGDRRRIKIGTSPLAGDAEVRIDPDRLFGRHLAVLGNTGSGKSCSVAGLIRWCIEQASAERGARPNARFIVLDPNGEYSRAFRQSEGPTKARVFRVDPTGTDIALKVPLWFWNSAEWISFTQASPKTQRPTLMLALRLVKDDAANATGDPGHQMRRFLRTVLSTIRVERNTGSPWGTFPKPKSFFEKIGKWKQGMEPELATLTGDREAKLRALVNSIEALCVPRRIQYAHMDFTRPEVDDLLQKTSEAHSAFGGTESDVLPPDVDAPKPFDGQDFIHSVEAAAEILGVEEHAETLLIRIRSLLTDTRMKPILGATQEISLQQWLESYVGNDDAATGCLSIVDLSLVPTDVVHIITSVIARIVFEALQRYVKLNSVSLPTVLVMEEAHTFIKRYRDDAEDRDVASVCCQVFERIAREGRKFGLGLVLSSQRPSELSQTVLSQCNTFLLHRISNDRDQELVQRLVPDNLRGLLGELPSLPSQDAILLGWASALPVLVHMNDLPKDQQPQSEDPGFWSVWTGKDSNGNPLQRNANWAPIAEEWQRPSTGTRDTQES